MSKGFFFSSFSSQKGRGFRISLQTAFFRPLEMEEGSNLHDGATSSAESAGLVLEPDGSAAASQDAPSAARRLSKRRVVFNGARVRCSNRVIAFAC